MASTDIISQHLITTTQKQYLVNKLMTLKKRKFATQFRSPIDPDDPANAKLIDVVDKPIDLSTIAANLLDDKYLSIQEFQDDIQLIGDNANKRHGLESSVTAASNDLLEFVNKFMIKLPGLEAQVASDARVEDSTKLKKKRKASGSAEEPAAKKKTPKRPNGMSAKEWKEQGCLETRLKGYRTGGNPLQGRRPRRLVAEKVHELKQRERNAQKHAKDKPTVTDALTVMSELGRKVDTMPLGDSEDEHSLVEGTGEMVVNEERGLHNDTAEATGLPTDQADGAKVSGKTMTARSKTYAERLEELPEDYPTQGEINQLESSGSRGPNFLGRTASLERGWNFGQYHRKTNGFTAQDVLLPSADIRDERYCSHNRLSDLTRGEHQYMGGKHLIWTDLCGDELLSYSKDPLFLVVHALRRYHQKEKHVTIQFLDRRKAKSSNGATAAFFSALDYYTMFEIPRSPIWDDWTHTRLHPRKFTQEYLTQGPVLYSDGTFKQARVEDLIEDGLYEIFPEFHCPEDHTRAGLYTLQVVYRKIGYPPIPPLPEAQLGPFPPIYSYDNCAMVVPMTNRMLETVRQVTLNFRKTPDGADLSTIEPPLHSFICFLTFEKRRCGDPVFTSWIENRYTANDVLDLYADSDGKPVPGITEVANNLPGYMQYLDLIRDCITVFSLEPLPPNEVEAAHAFHSTMDRSYAYAAYDDVQHRDHVKSQEYCPDVHLLTKEENKKRREKKKEKDQASKEEAEAWGPPTTTTAMNERPMTEAAEEDFDSEQGDQEQRLLSSMDDDEELAAFSRNDQAAIPAEDLVFARAKASKRKF